MYGMILVSHSKKITDGLKEMIEEMTGKMENVKISSCGGADDGRLGTNSIAIMQSIEEFSNCEDIFIFTDIGSAILSAETGLELIDDDDLKNKVTLVDSPLVEGAFAGAVQASIGGTKQDILAEIKNVQFIS